MQLFVELILHTQHHATKYDADSLGYTALSPIIYDEKISDNFF